MDSPTLLTQLRQLGLWPEAEAVQREVLALAQRLPDARHLARELLQRNLLTPYQANQLLTGKGASLLIGGYLLLERLGEGGMGQVYKARHPRLHRVVALKVIRPELLTNPVAVERFCREIRLAAKLSHPNVVRAYDADQVGGSFHFAMQYLDGQDLARQVEKEGPLAVERACDYALQTALGLQHIHEHGMVHRDIKPSNLMITRPGAVAETGDSLMATMVGPVGPWGQVKILDLGTARLFDEPEESAGKKPALTKLGTVMGTADFMAPEQALSTRNADIRCDIYSLGCTLYLMLTGQPPFPGGGAIEKMMKHQLDPPPPVEAIRPGVPPVLLGVLAKLLAKKPAERYQMPREVAEALYAAADACRPMAAVPLATDDWPVIPGRAKPELEPIPEFAFDDAGPEPAAPAAVRLPARSAEWVFPALFLSGCVLGLVVLALLVKLFVF
jgi:serine/threonine-protein kinase